MQRGSLMCSGCESVSHVKGLPQHLRRVQFEDPRVCPHPDRGGMPLLRDMQWQAVPARHAHRSIRTFVFQFCIATPGASQRNAAPPSTAQPPCPCANTKIELISALISRHPIARPCARRRRSRRPAPASALGWPRTPSSKGHGGRTALRCNEGWHAKLPEQSCGLRRMRADIGQK